MTDSKKGKNFLPLSPEEIYFIKIKTAIKENGHPYIRIRNGLVRISLIVSRNDNGIKDCFCCPFGKSKLTSKISFQGKMPKENGLLKCPQQIIKGQKATYFKLPMVGHYQIANCFGFPNYKKTAGNHAYGFPFFFHSSMPPRT